MTAVVVTDISRILSFVSATAWCSKLNYLFVTTMTVLQVTIAYYNFIVFCC